MIRSILFFPFIAVFMLVMLLIAVLFFIFWIWMLVDCVKRDFRNDTEKIIWVLVIIFATWIGAVIYFFVIKNSETRGLSKVSAPTKKR